MENVIAILNTLKDFSPLGVAALAVLGLCLYIWKNPFKPIEGKLDKISDNHLHDLPRMADTMDNMAETLQRIEVSLGENFAHLRAKADSRR